MDANWRNNELNLEARENANTAGRRVGWTSGPTSLSSFSSILQHPPEVLHKELGSGKGGLEESYWKNSAIRAFVSKVPIFALDEALEKVALPTKESPVVVADLSSSSGPHSIRSMAHIIDRLRQRVSKETEFLAYFNDESSNDFNHLFKLWHNDGSEPENVYPGGVPGSFFEQLLGQSSVHVFHSSNCLPFLSKASSF
jgi:hypothetical protein